MKQAGQVVHFRQDFFPRISIAQNYKQTKTYGIIKKLSF
jgi:hypothetical protein